MVYTPVPPAGARAALDALSRWFA